jgi:hypothetical protein
MNENIRQQLLQAAVLAPSADNRVPYLLDWQANGDLLMRLNQEHCGSVSDAQFTLSDLAVGTAIESIALAALSLGYQAKPSLFPNGLHDHYTVANIQFSPIQSVIKPEQTEVSLAQQIPLRCTDRRFPFHGTVSDDEIAAIQSAINSTRCKLDAFNTKQKIAPIIPLIFQAEKVRFEAEQLHRELFDAIVFNRKSSASGMNLNVIGVRWFEAPGFYCVSKWKILKLLNKLGASRLLAHKSVTQPLRHSPALLLLSSAATDRSSIIEAGRQMQRVWLKCTESGLAVQIYAAPGVLSLVKPVTTGQHVAVLEQVAENLSKITGKDWYALIFFRIGRVSGSPERSGRCSIENIQRS